MINILNRLPERVRPRHGDRAEDAAGAGGRAQPRPDRDILHLLRRARGPARRGHGLGHGGRHQPAAAARHGGGQGRQPRRGEHRRVLREGCVRACRVQEDIGGWEKGRAAVNK